MFCPQCGQERLSTETKFCSKCGFLLSGTLELLMTGGIIPSQRGTGSSKVDSPRSRGVKQGLFIFLLTFLIVPIIAILTVAVHAEPYLVVISSILLFVGGLLRMAYAWMFEAAAGGGYNDLTGDLPERMFEKQMHGELPSAIEPPAASFFTPAPGSRKTTNDLQPGSVTEGTTRLLEKEQFDQ